MEPDAAARRQGDRELMRSIARRDSAALGVLYDRYAPAVFPIALRILRDRAEAEELLGDVFWELWTQPERYDPTRGTVWAFLATLARSRGIDRLRSRRSQREATVALASVASPPANPGPSPFQSAALAEQRARIDSALAGLAEGQRQAIELAFYEGMTHAEISEALGEPLGTVKGRIRLGLIRLRELLRNSYGGGP